MPLAYYKRLSASDKRIYRRSDQLAVPVLPAPEALKDPVAEVNAGLLSDDVRATQRASTRLVRGVVEQLCAPPVSVRVLAVRPGDEYAELHGLYEAEEGRRPVIRVWMRTNVKKQPVALRTFVRTLLHEVCHHLDFAVHGLEESFHTEGFFRREAALARQLLGESKRRPRRLQQMELELAPARRR